MTRLQWRRCAAFASVFVQPFVHIVPLAGEGTFTEQVDHVLAAVYVSGHVQTNSKRIWAHRVITSFDNKS